MTKDELKDAILVFLYEQWVRSEQKPIKNILKVLAGINEKELWLAVDDLTEDRQIKGVTMGGGYELTPEGVIEAENRGLLSKALIRQNAVVRSTILRLVFDLRENEGSNATVNLTNLVSAHNLEENVASRNVVLLRDLGWIEFTAGRNFRITPIGRNVRRQQLEKNEKPDKKKKQSVFETISNSYKVQRILGQGGVGIVYEVIDGEGAPFALKVMRDNVLSTDKVKRFRQELEFLKAITHSNLVPVLDEGFITKDGRKIPFYVMPKYDGTLADRIKAGIEPEAALKYFANMLDGLEVLHLRGNFHRDFKPENVLFDGSTDSLVVGDLGAAHFAEEELFTAIETRDDARMANFEFAAPEQRERGRAAEVNHLADIYAVGLVLNKMFTGRTPSGEGYPKIAEAVSNFAYLDELVTQMIGHAPEDRFQSIQDIKIRLKALEKNFVSLQKLNRLRNEVVQSVSPVDPLVETPVQIVGVDFDHDAFRFELDRNVNEEWRQIFANIDDRNHGLLHAWPQDMEVSGNVISVSCTGQAAGLKQSGVLIRDLVTRYVNTANNRYEEHVSERTRQIEENRIRAEKDAIEQKKHEIALEDERRRILTELTSTKDG